VASTGSIALLLKDGVPGGEYIQMDRSDITHAPGLEISNDTVSSNSPPDASKTPYGDQEQMLLNSMIVLLSCAMLPVPT
jgi:hypothetical protein